MNTLALRNLLHDKTRFAVTLVGIVFAVVLIAVQTGLFLGFVAATTNLIGHSGADLWVTARGVRYIEIAEPFSQRQRYLALGVPGVARVSKYIAHFSDWQLPSGAHENVLIVGFDPDQALGRPWNVVAGSTEALRAQDTVTVDRLYMKKLGVDHLGQTVDIRGRRARVVAFTEGIRSFTTAPPVFTSFKNAQDYDHMKEDETLFLLVATAPGADVESVRGALRRRLSGVDVRTQAEFAAMTRNYWLFGTGAGVTVLIAAFLGLLVGSVVVTQTLYATTMEKIKEFGTLKAIGASNAYVRRVILEQAMLSAAIGYGAGLAIALVAERGSRTGAAEIRLPLPALAALLVATVAMCAGAALISVRKVAETDPAEVFR